MFSPCAVAAVSSSSFAARPNRDTDPVDVKSSRDHASSCPFFFPLSRSRLEPLELLFVLFLLFVDRESFGIEERTLMPPFRRLCFLIVPQIDLGSESVREWNLPLESTREFALPCQRFDLEFLIRGESFFSFSRIFEKRVCLVF